jgi:arabinofuranosyltransferase
VSPRRIILIALLVAAAVALVAHSLVFNFVTDDAFISFVYSRNLADHGQLVFNLGEKPVEGYTNFLWTVLLAGFLKLGLLPELMSRVLGTAFAIATFGTLAWLSRRVRGEDWAWWDAVPALILAGVPGYACWASGGLETQMFTFFVTLGAAWHLDEILGGEPSGARGGASREAVPSGMPALIDGPPRARSALAFGLAALTRPEGTLLFALTVAHRGLWMLSRRRMSIGRPELRWLGCFALLVVPHFVWRHWYYGWWLPNTFYIKSSGVGGTWQQGGYYLMRVVQNFHLWVVPLVVAAGFAVQRPRGARVLVGYATLVVAVFALYVASVGGDFMGLYRFVLPVIPLIALVTALSLRQLLSPVAPLPAAAVVALALGLHAWHAVGVDRRALVIGADRGPGGNIDTPGFLRWYTADRAAIGKWFARYARPDDYAAVGGAGAQVYYSRIRSLDCFGLSDEHIAHEMPAVSSRPGHQKYAPDDYILSKHPTIITSHNYMISNGPWVGSDAAIWMQRGYHYITVPVPGLSSPMYSFLLRNDRRLGDGEP